MMGTHLTEVEIGSILIEVEVDFDVTHYGCGPSGYQFDGTGDAGEPDEIEIKSVTGLLTGIDVERFCDMDKIEQEILSDPDYFVPPDDDYYDDYY